VFEQLGRSVRTQTKSGPQTRKEKEEAENWIRSLRSDKMRVVAIKMAAFRDTRRVRERESEKKKMDRTCSGLFVSICLVDESLDLNVALIEFVQMDVRLIRPKLPSKLNLSARNQSGLFDVVTRTDLQSP
jgi:hypothetical protein